MLKQLHICGSKRAGGAETFFLRFVTEMHKRSDTQIIPVVRKNSWLSNCLAQHQVPHHQLPFRNWLDFTTRKRIESLLIKEEPDIIQAWMSRASKVVPMTEIPTFARLGGYYNLKYYQTCDDLIGNTADIQSYVIQQGWPAARAHFISNFTLAPQPDFKEHRLALRDQFNLNSQQYVILLAARLHENKGIATAIYAMRDMPDDAHLLVIGEGPLKKDLQAMIDADNLNKKVTLAGWANNITPYAAAADVWLVSSRHEPLGNTVLDAWAHQVPIVSTDSMGPKSLIEHEKDGLLFPQEDPPAMAQAMCRIKKDPTLAATLVKNGLKTYQQHHTPDVILGQYLELYHTTISRNKA